METEQCWEILNNQSINMMKGFISHVGGCPNYSKSFLRTEINVVILAQYQYNVIQSYSSTFWVFFEGVSPPYTILSLYCTHLL